MKFTNINLGKRLAITFGAITLLTLVLFFASYQAMNHLSGKWDQFRTVTLEKNVAATKGLKSLGDGIHHFKNYLLRGLDYDQKFMADMDAIDQAAAGYATHHGDLSESEKSALKQIKESTDAYRAALKKAVEMKTSGATIEEIDKTIKGADKPLGKGFDDLLAAIQEETTASTLSVTSITASGERSIVIISLITVLLGVLLAWIVTRGLLKQLGGEPAAAAQLVANIADGKLDNAIAIRTRDNGSLMLSMKTMQQQLLERITADRKITEEALRIQHALDNVTTNVMIADNQHNIVYINKSMLPMFTAAQNDIRKAMPNFDVNKLVGSSMDFYHKNPAHQRRMLDALTTTFKTEIQVGGRTFALTANPVFNDRRERIGSVVEWADRTLEVAAEKELASIVNGAANGNFSVRMDTHGKTGFFLQLGEGMNQLMQTNETSLNEVARMLRALSQGNLNEKITNEYFGTFGQLKDDANATAEQLNEIILNEVGRVLEALSRGDLTEKISNDYPGAFGQLKIDANTTVEKLMEIIAQVKDSTDLINTAAQEIATGNNELSQRTEQQASSLEETASSMEELATTVKQNTESARHANQLTQGTSDIAAQSGKTVGMLVATMSAINKSSKKIEDIISVIDGIAFQTNILALNAAVEAARAGEQGRGFAVVASEVRNLAQRSAVAAKEIKLLISESVEKVSVGSRQVNEVVDEISDVVTSVQLVASLMKEITAATAEQGMSIEQVNQAITQMDDVTQQNAALVEQAAAAAESMQEQAAALDEAMGTFKLDEHTRRTALARRTAPARHTAQPKKMVATPRGELKLNKTRTDKDGNWKEF